jgi:hypothetical protein
VNWKANATESLRAVKHRHQPLIQEDAEGTADQVKNVEDILPSFQKAAGVLDFICQDCVKRRTKNAQDTTDNFSRI